jgi:uncharacterized membrane protein YqhA
LTGLQALFRRQHRGRLSLLPVVAGLCLVLLATLSIAQVTHLHSNPVDADHCQLCIVMHTAAPVTAVATAIVLVELGASAPQAEPIAIPRQRQLRLFIRPPPVSC